MLIVRIQSKLDYDVIFGYWNIVQAIHNVFSTPHSNHSVVFDYLNSLYIHVCVWVSILTNRHRRIDSIPTEFGRNISITCSSNVKRLRITKLGRISLQDKRINLVVISQYVTLNWRNTTSVNMGSVSRWLRTRFPHKKWVVHNFPVFEEAETLCQESPIHD